MTDEQTIATVVRAAGLNPSDASRTSIRAALSEAPTTTSATSTLRRRRWPVAIAGLAAAAAILVIALAVRSEDSSRRITPADSPATATTAPSHPSTGAQAAVSLDELRGHRWILIEDKGGPPIAVRLPYIEFMPATNAQTFLGGFDGCNLFYHDVADSSLQDSTLRIGSGGSTVMGCPTGVEPLQLSNNDELQLDASRSRLTVRTNGAPRLTFVRFDSLPLPNSAQIASEWSLAGAPYAPLVLAADGTATFGACQLTWVLDTTLTVSGWPSTGYCANDSENRLAVLAEALKGPVEVRLLSDTDMLVVGERLVVRLTRGPGAVPQSVGPPTTTSVVAPTSDATSVPVGLDGWPQPSTQPASLAMVPRLLPSELVPGGVSVLRSTASVATEGAVPTIELFYDLARNARVNIVTTLGTPNFSTDEMNLVATDTWPTRWASAYTPRHITNGYSSLLLESRDGSVDLWAMNLSTAELTEIARTMTRLPDGRPGWNLHPSAHLTKFASGGTMPGTERHMVWVDDRHAPVAELSVGYETPDVLSTPWKPDSTVETIDVPAATRALVITNPGGRVSIAWSEGAVHGLFSIRGDRATAERIVRSLHEAGDDQWNAAATEYDATIEPCLGLFC